MVCGCTSLCYPAIEIDFIPHEHYCLSCMNFLDYMNKEKEVIKICNDCHTFKHCNFKRK